MLHEFLTTHREELIARCRIKVAKRTPGRRDDADLDFGIPLFLDQLIKTLRVEQTSTPMNSRRVSGPSGGGNEGGSEIGEAANRHGRELLQQGFTIAQVVHDYGDLCQALTDLAVELGEPIQVDEFRTLNRCLDNGIADAVMAFTYQRDVAMMDRDDQPFHERLGCLAHELRNHIHTATLAVAAIKSGGVAMSGATGAVLDRSLIALRTLIDRSLADVRISAGMHSRHDLLPLAEFITEVRLASTLEAEARECIFTVSTVDPELAIDANIDILFSAVGNLLQNAFKFTRPRTEVTLNAYAVSGRILIDVQDHCGGLPADHTERIFQPFTQVGRNRSGLGLGLSICRRGVEASNGVLRVRNVPGSGCVFTIDLPCLAVPHGEGRAVEALDS